MKLRHATPSINMVDIGKGGIHCDKSKGKLPLSWFHVPSKTAWAILHTQGRHHVSVEQITVIDLDIPRSWLTRSAVRGLWKCGKNISPDRFKAFTKAIDFAVSPVADEG